MAWDYESTKDGYEAMWSSAEILDSAHYDLDMIADRIIQNEARYKEVEHETEVPWYWIGAIHSRESSCDFDCHLHNGDPLTDKTYHVPEGRLPYDEPPYTWEQSAIDALYLQELVGEDHTHPWDCAGMHLDGELYNGLGYVDKGVNSPYVWAGTTHQQPGKYVADGEWDPNAWDTQMGISAIWKKLCSRRPDIARAFRVEEGAYGQAWSWPPLDEKDKKKLWPWWILKNPS